MCIPSPAPAGTFGLPMGGASPRTVVFTVGSPPNSSTPPTCSHLASRPRTTSGEELCFVPAPYATASTTTLYRTLNALHRLANRCSLCSASDALKRSSNYSKVTNFSLCIHSGLQQLSRLLVLHQWKGVYGLSPGYDRRKLPARS